MECIFKASLVYDLAADSENRIPTPFPPELCSQDWDSICYRTCSLLLNPKWVSAPWPPQCHLLSCVLSACISLHFSSTSGSVPHLTASGHLVHTSFFVTVTSWSAPVILAACPNLALSLSQAWAFPVWPAFFSAASESVSCHLRYPTCFSL